MHAIKDNLLSENVIIVKKTQKLELHSSKEVVLEVRAEVTNYTFISRHQTTGQNHYINLVNKSFDDVAMFKHLCAAVTNQNSIHEEISNRLNFVKVFYHVVQNILFSRPLYKNLKIKV